MKKYELVTDQTKMLYGKPLYRIRALRDFYCVEKGDIGGYIEKEANLSQEGECWIFNDACVYDDAQICDDVEICDNAHVCDDARICGDAQIYNNTRISNNAYICGNAKVFDNARIFHNASIGGDARISGKVCVCGNAQISGGTHLYGNAFISHDAHIPSDKYWMAVSGIGSESATLTAFRQRDNSIRVKRGCYTGTLEEFKERVDETHGNGRYGKIYQMIATAIELQLDNIEVD